MAHKSIEILRYKIYSKPPKKNYPTKTTDVHLFDDIWSLDKLDKKDSGPENNRGYRYNFVVVDLFSKFGFTVPLKKKNAQTITNSSQNILICSKQKPNLIETDRG